MNFICKIETALTEWLEIDVFLPLLKGVSVLRARGASLCQAALQNIIIIGAVDPEWKLLKTPTDKFSCHKRVYLTDWSF